MKTKWAVFILLIAGVAAYGNTIGNKLFWDDDEFITRNAYIRSFKYIGQWFSQPMTAGAGVNSNYYRPLLQLSFAIDYKLWGLWPGGYHLENLIWHTVTGILLFVFLRKFLQNFEFATMTAFAASLLWLVHPVHVEAVAYANSRGDSLAAVFILLTLISWLKEKYQKSVIMFILALLSKEYAIVTPGLIILVEFIKYQIPDIKSKVLSSKIKCFYLHIIIFGIYVLLRLTILNFQNTLNFYGVDLTKVDQSQPLVQYATSLPTRLATFLKVLPIYGKILIWPDDLHMERTVEIATTTADKTVMIVVAVVIATLLYCCIAVKRKKFLLPFAIGWFFISILPVSGIIPISQILAEHFLYLPSMGVFLLAGKLLSDLNRLTKRELAGWVIWIMAVTFLLIKTIRQNRIWRDPITFYEYTLTKTKPTVRVLNNLAMAYADIGKHQKAVDNYRLAISLSDVYPNPHYNLGNTLVEMGNIEEAMTEYKLALAIDAKFYHATLKLGQLYLNQNKIQEAKDLICPIFPAQPLCRSSEILIH